MTRLGLRRDLLRLKQLALRLPFFVLLAAALAGCAGRGDALAPVVTITEPQGTTVKAESDLQIVGYAMDDVGVASILVDGTEILDAPGYAGERGKKLINFGFRPRQVREGLWRSEIVVTDVDSRKTSLTFPLEIDGTPPTVTLTGVEGLGGGNTRVSGVARDNDVVSKITTGDKALSFVPAAQIAFTFETTKDIEITVTDQAGNVTVFRP